MKKFFIDKFLQYNYYYYYYYLISFYVRMIDDYSIII